MAKAKDVEVKSRQPPVSRESYRPLSPFEEMERFMEGMFGSRWPRRFHGGWPSSLESGGLFERPFPRVDVLDKDDEVIVTAEIPGVKKEDLDVSVIGGRITIKGSSSDEKASEKGDYYRREISRGEFSRTLSLPAETDIAKAKASFDNGVLTVSLPKLEKAKRASIKVE